MSQDDSDTIHAPWTAEQVAGLNAWQASGQFHPYTCGDRGDHVGEDILVATSEGWVCPHEGCQYQQKWAHAVSAEPLPKPWWERLQDARRGRQP